MGACDVSRPATSVAAGDVDLFTASRPSIDYANPLGNVELVIAASQARGMHGRYVEPYANDTRVLRQLRGLRVGGGAVGHAVANENSPSHGWRSPPWRWWPPGR